jgi:hypothetical protein
MSRKPFLFICLLSGVVWGLCSGSAQASVSAIVAPGEDSILYSTPLPIEEVSGVRIYNPPESLFNFKVEIEGVTLGSLPAYPVESGFQLVDITQGLRLTVQNEETRERLRELPARAKARVRLAYTRDEIRAKGRNARKLVLMRLVGRNEARRMWISCRRLMREKNITAIRRIGSPVFETGYYGNDEANQYVWAVTNLPGTYALGIPEPASLLLAAAGAGLLAIRRR